ncbi:BPI2 domain-containing protein [Aphelenchoides besseyi]|nr:BPI2 domain-containing protein [Aphelenchoides besseyi]
MGLITDSVNIKYKKEMIDKTREIISMTICSNIEKTIRDQVNQRFKEIPKHISLYELFQYLDHTATEVQPRPSVARDPHSLRQYRTHLQQTALQFRQKRRAEMQGVATVVEILSADIHDRSKTRYRSPKSRTKFRQASNNDENQVLEEIPEEDAEPSKTQSNNSDNEAADLDSSTNRSPTTKRVGSRPSNSDGWKNVSMKAITPTRTTYVVKPMSVAGLKGFLDTIDVNSLARLFVNLDFLDSVSDDDSFTVGMDGSILLNASPYSGNYGDPLNSEEAAKLQFPAHVNHRSMEVVIGEFTPNSLLQQAHRAKLLRFHIKNNTPLFGKMLKTSCTPDEICISDSIPEVGEKYPNKLLDIVVESVRPPRFVIGEDEFRIMMIGNAIFYLTESRHEIGKIPFSTIVRVGVRAIDQVLHVNLTIPHLEILDDINFFELPPESLGGFRDAVKGAIENMAKKDVG